MLRHPIVQLVIVVFAVGPDNLQTRKSPRLDAGQGLLGSLGIVHRRGCDHNGQHHSHGIHDDVALAPCDFLGSIVAAFAAHLRGLDRLAVNRSCAGRHIPAILEPDFDAQGCQELVPERLINPQAEVVVHGSPRREFMRQHPPLATRAIQIEQRVENFA